MKRLRRARQMARAAVARSRRMGADAASERRRAEELGRVVGTDARLIVEVGANDGQDSLALLEAFPNATLHCFEAEPRAIARWEKALRTDRAHLYPIALGATNGPVCFYQSTGTPPGQEADFPDGWHLSGSLRPPTGHLDTHPWCRFETTIEVEGRTLDSWAADTSTERIDLIWADVQGAEVDLILGGRSTLNRTRFLYTEFSDQELYLGQLGLDGILDLLPGWEIECVYRHDVLLRNERWTARDNER